MHALYFLRFLAGIVPAAAGCTGHTRIDGTTAPPRAIGRRVRTRGGSVTSCRDVMASWQRRVAEGHAQPPKTCRLASPPYEKRV